MDLESSKSRDSDSSDSININNNYVVSLDISNFDTAILTHPLVVVRFYSYSSWMIPETDDLPPWYVEASELLRTNNQVLLAKVSLDDQKYLRQKYVVRTSPKVIIFYDKGNQFHEYKGPFDVQGFVGWCLNKLRHLNNPNPVKLPLIVGHFPTTHDDVTDYDAEYDVIEYGVHPIQLISKYFCGGSGKAKVMLFMDCESEGAHAGKFVSRYHMVAKNYRERGIHFMLGDSKACQDAYRFFNLHKGGKTPLIAIRTVDGGHYSIEKLESEDEIGAFVADYKAGKLPILGESAGPVNVNEVFAESFQKKELDPVLNAVATRYKTASNVAIFKLFNNDHEIRDKSFRDDPYTIAKDCPTLFFKRASSKEFIIYHGLRTKDCILEFIEANRDKATKDKPVEIESIDEVNNLIGMRNSVIVVGIFSEFCGQEFDNFCEVADELKLDYEFRIMNAVNCPNKGYCPVVWLFTYFPSYKEPFHETTDFNVYALVNFVRKESFPLITFYGQQHSQLLIDRFFIRRNHKVMLFIDREGARATAFESIYREVAKTYRGEAYGCYQLSFMLGDLGDSKEALSLYFDVEKDDEPFIVIMDFHGDIYVKDNLKDVDDVESFVKDYKEGILDDKFKKFRALAIYSGPLGNHVEEYNGPRDAQGIVDCLKRISAPTLTPTINSLQDVHNLILPHKNNIVIVGVFSDFCGEEYDNFVETAETYKWDYDFYITKHLPHNSSSHSHPVVKLFDRLNFDDDALLEFVKKNSTPPITLYNVHPPLFVDKFFYSDLENDKAMLFINRDSDDARSFESKYYQVANKYREKGISFMLGDELKTKKALSEYCGFTWSDKSIIIIWNRCGKFYVKTGFKLDYKIEVWVDDYKEGRVTEYKRSDPIPEKNDGLVKVVVADNFAEMVMDSAKNVLLELYRSTGGTFEEWAGILNDVANHFKGDNDVLIAMLDETSNDIRSECPDDFKTHEDGPTMYFITAERKIKMYTGPVTKDAIINFIMTKSKKMPRPT
ncbi:hypothetical protein ACFE04_009765 [Oxalis oulophora]